MVMSVNVREKTNPMMRCFEAKDAQNIRRGLTDTPALQSGVNHLLHIVSLFNSVEATSKITVLLYCRS